MEEKARGKHLERLRLRILGASCSTCIMPIRRVLERTLGVYWVGANLILDLIFVEYDPKLTNLSQILMAVRKAGYEAVQASA